MEKDREEELKRQKQREAREIYAQTVQMRRAQEEREMKEQVAFDMKLLEQLLEQTNAEAALELNKKVRVTSLTQFMIVSNPYNRDISTANISLKLSQVLSHKIYYIFTN